MTRVLGKSGGTGVGWAVTFKSDFVPVRQQVEVMRFGDASPSFVSGRIIGYRNRGEDSGPYIPVEFFAVFPPWGRN